MASAERKYTLYMHTSPSGKRYIGITRQTVKARWESGGQGYRTCSYFWHAICKHGWSNITHQIIAEGLTEEEAKRSEKELIAFYKTRDPSCGYNLTDGGDGLCGVVPSIETRAKISAGNMGQTRTAETRAKISAAHKGNHYCLGIKHTDESKRNMRDGWARRAKAVECLTKSGEIVGHYTSCADAAKKTGINRVNISRVCCGQRKTAGKFKWRFV
jgi:group I intron endonuclease